MAGKNPKRPQTSKRKPSKAPTRSSGGRGATRAAEQSHRQMRAVVIFFLALLLYTLFFALPFSATYAPGSGPAPLCRTGVYALCRHPGVLWLSLFYFSLWLAAGSAELFAAFLGYTVLDVAYQNVTEKQTPYELFFSKYQNGGEMKTYSGLYDTKQTRHYISMTLGFRF